MGGRRNFSMNGIYTACHGTIHPRSTDAAWTQDYQHLKGHEIYSLSIIPFYKLLYLKKIAFITSFVFRLFLQGCRKSPPLYISLCPVQSKYKLQNSEKKPGVLHASSPAYFPLNAALTWQTVFSQVSSVHVDMKTMNQCSWRCTSISKPLHWTIQMQPVPSNIVGINQTRY